ncbi:hypothetical protein ACI2VH_02645 [Ralstonia nicotianae]
MATHKPGVMCIVRGVEDPPELNRAQCMILAPAGSWRGLPLWRVMFRAPVACFDGAGGHIGSKLITTLEQQYLVPIDEPGLDTGIDTGAKKPEEVLA